MVSKPVTFRSIWRSVLLTSVVACSGAKGTSDPAQKPDLVLYGGDVHTMDPARPRASAIAIAGDKIIAVGSDSEIRQLGATREIALAGKTVTPGLVDAHCHLYGLGVNMERVQLLGLTSADAVAQTIALAAKQRPASEWLLGRGWDQNLWQGQQFPTRASLEIYSLRGMRVRRLLPKPELGELLAPRRYGRPRAGDMSGCDPDFRWDGTDGNQRTVLVRMSASPRG